MTDTVPLLNTLRGKVKLGIITNGFVKVQEKRLVASGLENHFDLLVISESVGAAKPQKQIFDYALEKMGNPDKNSVLIVGDNIDTDIRGGINAGIYTCWLNTHNKIAHDDVKPHFEVRSLRELIPIFGLSS